MFKLLDASSFEENFPEYDTRSEEEIRNDLYREISRGRCSRKISGEVFNDTFQDSITVFETFFDFCDEEINILARGIRDKIFNQTPVIESSSNFICKEKTKLHMDLRVKNKECIEAVLESEFLKNLRNLPEAENKVTINFYIGNRESWLPHLGSFVVGDKRMYRYRHKQKPSEFELNGAATVDYNDKKKCEELLKKLRTSLKDEKLIRPFSI